MSKILVEAMANLDEDVVLAEVKSLKDQNVPALDIIESLQQGMKIVGKNIVTTIMRSNGFEVIDLRVDVPAAKFIEAINQYKPKVIGISCFLTTCFDNVKERIRAVEEAGLRNDVKFLIGGGPVDEATDKYIKANVVCKNAQQTVDYCKQYAEVK